MSDQQSREPSSAPGSPDRPTVLGPLHLRLFALLFDYATIVGSVKLAEQILLGEHWDLRPLAVVAGWRIFATPWQGAMLALLLLRDLPGASIGKWLTGIAVRRAADPARAAGIAARVVRNLSLVLLPVDAWLVFSDRFGRRLGDRWAGTIVVQNPKPQDLFQRAMGLGALFLGFVLAALLITSWNLHRSAAFQTAYAAALVDAALKQQVGQPAEVERSPELELRLPGGSGAFGPIPRARDQAESGTATAVFDATGPAGKAKLRVDLELASATAEPARWNVVRTEVLDALGAPLRQREAPPKP